MEKLNRPARLLPGICLGLLAACSSGGKPPAAQRPMSESMEKRLMRWDMNKRSSFESSLVRNHSGMGDHLQQRGFNAREFKGNTAYRTPKTLKQHSFSGADERSRLASQTFNGAGQKNRLAKETFSTPAAREGGLHARQQNEVFRESNDVFQTGMVRDAARSQAENKRPLIIKNETESKDAAAYSEDEIRRLVNRR